MQGRSFQFQLFHRQHQLRLIFSKHGAASFCYTKGGKIVDTALIAGTLTIRRHDIDEVLEEGNIFIIWELKTFMSSANNLCLRGIGEEVYANPDSKMW